MTRNIYNFLRGTGSVIDLSPRGNSTSVIKCLKLRGVDLTQSHVDALGQDWDKITHDLRVSVHKVVKEIEDHGAPKKAK